MNVWMRIFAVGVLLPALIKTEDPVDAFVVDPLDPSWGDVTFEDSTCQMVDPKNNSMLGYKGPVYKPGQCGSIQKKRGFFETILKRGKDNRMETRVTNGGIEIPKNKWPWLAAVGTKTGGPICGGALINDQWILSAGHCFHEETYPCDWNVRLGEHHFLEYLEHQVDVEAENLYAYPTFNYSIFANDPGLIKLKEPVDISTDEIRPVCLADSMDPYPPGTRCFMAGWGDPKFSGVNAIPRAPLEMEVELWAYEKCVEAWGDDGVHEGFFCGKGLEGRYGCFGDSGSPLVCKHPTTHRWEVLGIYSASDDCGEGGAPDLYTSVPYYREFIESVLNQGRSPPSL